MLHRLLSPVPVRALAARHYHRSTAVSMNMWAAQYRSLPEVKEASGLVGKRQAISLLKRAADICTRAMPRGHALPVIAQVRLAAAHGSLGDYAAAAALLVRVLADTTAGGGGAGGAGPSPQAPAVARGLAVARLHLAALLQRAGPADNPWEATAEGAAEAAEETAATGRAKAAVAETAEEAAWEAFKLTEALDAATPDVEALGEALHLVGLARVTAGNADAVDYLQQATRTCRDGAPPQFKPPVQNLPCPPVCDRVCSPFPQKNPTSCFLFYIIVPGGVAPPHPLKARRRCGPS